MKKISSLLLLLFFTISVNAQSWNSVGTGMQTSVSSESVLAMATYGTDLYVGGFFDGGGGVSSDYIAKWNGTAWSSVAGGLLGVPVSSFGGNGVYAMVQYGSYLYIGGGMSVHDGNPSTGIVRWDGTSFSAVGSGLINNGIIYAMTVHAGQLYVAGAFDSAGGVAANNIAKWNGTSWSAVGTGINGTVKALASYGGNLYAGGTFTSPSSNITKWNGSAWTSVASGLNGDVAALCTHGSDLYATGYFTASGGTSLKKIGRWNGTVWSAVGSGIDPYSVGGYALASSGGNLYVGGGFTTSLGASSNYIAKWDGAAWSSLSTSTNGVVQSLISYGGSLYVGGLFTQAGGVARNKIARWGNIIGIDENEFQVNTKVFPNPFTDKVTMSFGEQVHDCRLSVLDVVGREVKSLLFDGDEVVFNRETLAAGVYFLNVFSAKNELLCVRKVVIQ